MNSPLEILDQQEAREPEKLVKIANNICYDHTQCGEDCTPDCPHYAETKPEENNPYVHDLEQQIELLEQRIDYMQLELQQAEVKVSYNDFLEEELLKARAKAEAYDRLMSGGKKTPKEVADFLGKPIAMDRVGAWYEHKSKPSIGEGCYEGMWVSGTTVYVKSISVQIDYSGDWEHSLTLPDGWEEK